MKREERRGFEATEVLVRLSVVPDSSLHLSQLIRVVTKKKPRPYDGMVQCTFPDFTARQVVAVFTLRMIKVKCGDDLAVLQEQAFGCTPDFCALRGKQKYNLLAHAVRSDFSL